MRAAPAGIIGRKAPPENETPEEAKRRKFLDNCWKTPEKILRCVRYLFGGEIPFDPATAPDNPTRARRWCAGDPERLEYEMPLYAPELYGVDLARQNGLLLDWEWDWFCNPPYGAELRKWLPKMADQARRVGRRGIALLPCARWEQEYFTDVLDDTLMCLIRGRVSFISAVDNLPVSGNTYASMILGFNWPPTIFASGVASLGPTYALAKVPVEEALVLPPLPVLRSKPRRKAAQTSARIEAPEARLALA